jgi:hypothetical protein
MEMGKTYTVKFDVTLPDGINATEKQIEDWVAFELHAKGQLNPSPVSGLDLEANAHSVDVMEQWP